MTTLTFPEFRPDMPGLDGGYTNHSMGVLPGPNCLLPLPQTTAYTGAMTGGRCLGAIAVRLPDDTVDIYGGTGTTLEKMNKTTLAWADVSKAGGYTITAGYYWTFVPFGSTLIAYTDNVAPQFIDITGGGLFANLAGSPPTTRYGAIVSEFLVSAGYTATPNKMEWSAIGDATGHTAGTNQSDTQTFPAGGKIQNVTGGRTSGTVFQEDTIRRMTYVGGDAIFRFDQIAEDVGLLAPLSVTSVFGADYFYSGKGFMRLNADGSIDRIGANKVDDWFETAADSANHHKIIGVSDPIQKLVWFLFHSSSSATDYQDKALVYSWATDQWRPVDNVSSFMFSLITPGATLEGLEDTFGYTNLDTIPFSLDGRIWQGATPVLGSFSSDDKLHFFNGDNAKAEAETGLFQLNPTGRAFMQGISPIIEVADAAGSPSPTVAIGSRNASWDDLTWSSTAGTAVNDVAGEAPFEISGRDFKARVKLAAGASWTKLHGIRQPRFLQDGRF